MSTITTNSSPVSPSIVSPGLEATPSPVAAGAAPQQPALMESQAAPQFISLFKDANGAPSLSNPVSALSPDDLISALDELRNKSLVGQESTAKNSITKSRIDLKNANEAQQKKIQEWIEKCEKEAKAGFWGKVCSWIGKVLAFIAAVAAVVVTGTGSVFSGGAATPLFALACIGLVTATVSLIDQIVKETGHKDGFTLSSLLTKPFEKLLIAFGVPEEKAKQISQVAMAAALLVSPGMLLLEPQLLGNVAKGICQLSGAPENVTSAVSLAIGLAATLTVGIVMVVLSRNASSIDALTQATSKLGSVIAGSATQLIGATTQVGEGTTRMVGAHYQSQANEKLEQKKLMESFIMELQKSLESGGDDLKKIIQQLQDAVESVSQMINSLGESTTLITHNMNKSPV